VTVTELLPPPAVVDVEALVEVVVFPPAVVEVELVDARDEDVVVSSPESSSPLQAVKNKVTRRATAAGASGRIRRS
jgi:hypothetical protein